MSVRALVVFILGISCMTSDLHAEHRTDVGASIVIRRAAMVLDVIGPDGAIAWSTPIGIGRGGLREKSSMADEVTPLGEFEVDLVLSKAGSHDSIAPTTAARFSKEPELGEYVADRAGLAKLFRNMNGIDFNGDGSPDGAYGSAYIGLSARASGGITGPKLTKFRGAVPYWFSIALHGTPDARNIGKANSGGCVHVPEEALERLIEKRTVRIGTPVVILE